MTPDQFMSDFRDALLGALDAPLTKSAEGAATLEQLAERVEGVAKAVESTPLRENFDLIAKSFDTISEHLTTHADVLESILNRLESLEGASAVRKSAAGQDGVGTVQKSRSNGTFGNVISALAAGQAVELR
jgi:hypothetical protein